MLNLAFNLVDGTASLAKPTTIKPAEIPVKIVLSDLPSTVSSPGVVTLVQVSLCTDTAPPSPLAFADFSDFTAVDEVTYTATLSSNTDEIATYMANLRVATIIGSVRIEIDGVLQESPNFVLRLEPSAIAGPDLTAGHPTYLTTGYIDTDVTLAANSDSKVPSQKAVKAYVAAHGGGGGGGSGTVTSVAASGGTTGFAFTGGPVTGSGTLTLTVSNAGTIRTAIGLGSIATHATSEFSAVAGSASIVTVGTITTGTWHGTEIADSYIASASTWNGKQAHSTTLDALAASNPFTEGSGITFSGTWPALTITASGGGSLDQSAFDALLATSAASFNSNTIEFGSASISDGEGLTQFSHPVAAPSFAGDGSGLTGISATLDQSAFDALLSTSAGSIIAGSGPVAYFEHTGTGGAGASVLRVKASNGDYTNDLFQAQNTTGTVFSVSRDGTATAGGVVLTGDQDLSGYAMLSGADFVGTVNATDAVVRSLTIGDYTGVFEGNCVLSTDSSNKLISGAGFTGDGSSLTSLTASELTFGTIPAARTADGSVTLAKLANISSGGVLGNTSGSAAAPSLQTWATVKTALSLSGTNTGDQTTVSGNAGTATALQTARTINGVSFDGMGNITVTAAAGTLSGSALASGVSASSLTSVGTLSTLNVSGGATLGSIAVSSTVDSSLDFSVTAAGNIAGGPAAFTALTVNGVSITTNGGGAAAAGTLTGATLKSTVTASSLTSVGTIATGVWQGTAIGDTYISSAATWNAKQSALTFSTGLTNTGGTVTVNAAQTQITSVGTLTGGATGAGFTLALGTSTITGTIPTANTAALTGDVTKSAGSNTTTIANLPAISGAALTSLTAANITASTAGGRAILNLAAPTNGAYEVTWTGGVPSYTAPSGGASVANPSSQLIGLTAINGSASTAMRSDGAPALSQAIAPTWTSAHVFSQSALGVTTVAGVTLINPTAAASGAQQVSPALVLSGQGRATTPANSQQVDYRLVVLPVQGSTNPTAQLLIQSQVNGTGWGGAIVTIDSGTGATTVSSLISGSITSSGNINAAFNGVLALNGRGGMSASADGSFKFRNNANSADASIAIGSLTASGDIALTKTITASGTTGAQTINKNTGRVNFAAAATSLVVTNSLCTVNSVIQCTIATNDTTAANVKAVAGTGSFTIYLGMAPTAETAVNFTLTN